MNITDDQGQCPVPADAVSVPNRPTHLTMKNVDEIVTIRNNRKMWREIIRITLEEPYLDLSGPLSLLISQSFVYAAIISKCNSELTASELRLREMGFSLDGEED